MVKLPTEKYQKKLYSDENLIKLFEVDEINYNFAYSQLVEKYPEMYAFEYPLYHIEEMKQAFSYKAIFNSMFNAFKKMLNNCPYLCLLTGFKADKSTHEIELKYPEIKLIPVLDEYAIRDTDGNDTTKLREIFFDDKIDFHDPTLPYFTKFAKTLEKRHKRLFELGVLKEEFKPNELFTGMDEYLHSLKNAQQKSKKEKTEELDKEL